VKRKPVITRSLANQDVDEAIAYYLAEHAEPAALRLIEALERTYARIAKYPDPGSPRYAHELDLPGLRYWPVTRYPYLIFCIDRPDRIDVWRVLHGPHDIPIWMREAEEP
jgi:toxin ParE1/3/4